MASLNVDLTNCDREPIRVPGKIQPHGALLAMNSNGRVKYVSANCEALLGVKAEKILGQVFEEVFPGTERLRESGNLIRWSHQIEGEEKFFDVVTHEQQEKTIIEFEPSLEKTDPSFSNIYQRINLALKQIETSQNLSDLFNVTAREAKHLSGFDRVMIYKFDEEWNGQVVAEAKEDHQEAFLGLQYPASDIPAQARALYLQNWIRLIPDVGYEPVSLFQQSIEPLDMGFCALRSVSPVHIQYLKNMKVGASMSVSIIKDEKLWGLISFHHETPRYLPYELRQGLEFLGKYFSLQLAAKVRYDNREYRVALKQLQPLFREAMKRAPHFLDGLHRSDPPFLSLASGVTGGAICYREEIDLFGKCPTTEEVRELKRWLSSSVGTEPVYFSDSLSKVYPAAAAFANVASGMACLSIPEPEPSYVIWFKPEVIQTINWSGDPKKPVEITDDIQRLSPRRSFALWQETVRQKSLPWAPEEIEAIEDLRRSILEADLERQVIIARRSNEELDHFAQLVAHDLQEPLRGIGAFAQFVAKDESGRLSEDSVENLSQIRTLTEKGKQMISTLYEFSKISRMDFAFSFVDLNPVLEDVRFRLKYLLMQENAELVLPMKLPVVYCDKSRVAEVFANLITNAVKYNRAEKKRVEVGYERIGGAVQFYVKDNGIGIDDDDQGRIFNMFERLHEEHEYGGGSGAGLALVKRIISRHRGKIWVQSKPGSGTTFYFTLECAK